MNFLLPAGLKAILWERISPSLGILSVVMTMSSGELFRWKFANLRSASIVLFFLTCFIQNRSQLSWRRSSESLTWLPLGNSSLHSGKWSLRLRKFPLTKRNREWYQTYSPYREVRSVEDVGPQNAAERPHWSRQLESGQVLGTLLLRKVWLVFTFAIFRHNAASQQLPSLTFATSQPKKR